MELTLAKPLTPKQEKFCQKYVELGNASEAYRFAYDAEDCTIKSTNELASQELGKVKVTSRVDEIRAELAERNAVTLDSLSKELDGAIGLAKDLEQPSPMVTGILGKAKMHGFMIEKSAVAKVDLNDLLGDIMAGKNVKSKAD